MAGQKRTITEKLRAHLTLNAQGFLALSLVLLLATQASLAALDSLTHSHVICPEHGELVHSESEFHATAASGKRNPVQNDGQSVDKSELASRPAATLSDHSHEHCVFGCSLRNPGWASPAKGEAEKTWPALEIAFIHSALIANRVPLYLLAPKNSPPV
jgi:hypothetical protein